MLLPPSDACRFNSVRKVVEGPDPRVPAAGTGAREGGRGLQPPAQILNGSGTPAPPRDPSATLGQRVWARSPTRRRFPVC